MFVPLDPPPSGLLNMGSQRPRLAQRPSLIERSCSAVRSHCLKASKSEILNESAVSASAFSRLASKSEKARRDVPNSSAVPRSGLKTLREDRGLPSNLAGSQYLASGPQFSSIVAMSDGCKSDSSERSAGASIGFGSFSSMARSSPSNDR